MTKQQTISKHRITLLSNQTQAERHFQERMVSLGIYNIPQKGFYEGSRACVVDFYIPRPHKICIEIDGNGHLHTKQKIKDFLRTEYLVKERGFRVVRLRNKEVFNLSDVELLERIFLNNNTNKG